MANTRISLFEPITKLVPLNYAKAPLRVLIVVPEVSPYATVGGVSRVASHLAKELVSLGHDVRLFMPKYGFIDEEKYPLEMVVEGLKVRTGEEEGVKELICNVKTHLNEWGVRTYFLENMEYYEKRANVYGYSDDPTRFALLSRGSLEFLRHFEWKPQVIHSNDWQTGALSNFLKTSYGKSRDLAGIATVFTIHNLFYQGMFDHRQVSEMDFDDGRAPLSSLFSERLRKQNFMKRGIIYSDMVNTVSETYSREILTPEYGEGLDKLLLEVRSKLFGITNGIDYDDFNPETDPLVPYNFNIHKVHERVNNKLALQKEFGLPQGQEHFLLGMVSRMTEQKGMDILLDSLPRFLESFDGQFIVVGGGEEKYVAAMRELQKEYPKKVGVHLMPNFTLPRLLFSGVDATLVPSRFEPAGLTQLESMRYGAIPIVRKTGGLADTVVDLDAQKNLGTGFIFEEYSPWALFAQLVRSQENFRNQLVWRNLVKRAMLADFSWESSAKKYADLYRRAIQLRAREQAESGVIIPLKE
ncbi:MAG: glycogen/starch synthase [Patescibacteria group bacterium]